MSKCSDIFWVIHWIRSKICQVNQFLIKLIHFKSNSNIFHLNWTFLLKFIKWRGHFNQNCSNEMIRLLGMGWRFHYNFLSNSIKSNYKVQGKVIANGYWKERVNFWPLIKNSGCEPALCVIFQWDYKWTY